jgi:transposase
MDLLGEADLAAIETQIYGGMIDRYGLDLASVALDMTNFATYIDTTNDRAPIAQRGKAKQKRVDLRLVGLALVVTRDGGIPIVSPAYPGDRPDVTQFSTVLDELVVRYRLLVEGVDSLTVVYDAGQNSRDNHAFVEQSAVGFVGSLPPSDHPDLLEVPRSRYRVVDADRFGELTAFGTTVTALGVTRRAVITHSPTLHAAQSRGLDQTLAKARTQLADLQDRLHRGNTRRPRATVEADIAAICKPRWVNQILSAALTGHDPQSFRLSFRTNTRARTKLEDRLFGKRILFTNRDHWSIADVVAAYRSQSDTEFGFRQLKDRHVVSFSPMHHWTDQKIRVHVFYCVLALAVAHLMRRHAAQAGLALSVRELLDHLAGIGETVLLHHDGGKGRPRAQRILTDLTDTQRRLFDLFGLDRYAPTR